MAIKVFESIFSSGGDHGGSISSLVPLPFSSPHSANGEHDSDTLYYSPAG